MAGAVGALVAITASLTAWLIIRGLRPRLVLSAAICINPDGFYCVKVFNTGKRAALCIRIYGYAVRLAHDPRYPQHVNVDRLTLNPGIVPMLYGQSTAVHDLAAVGKGRIVRLDPPEGHDSWEAFWNVFPNASIVIQAVAEDSFTSSKAHVERVYPPDGLHQGVFERDSTAIRPVTPR